MRKQPCVVHSSFISSSAASAQAAVSSFYPLFDNSMSCCDFFLLLDLVAVASILNILVLIYRYFCIYVKIVNCVLLRTVMHMAACFFQLKALKLLDMPLRFNSVKASVSSCIPQLLVFHSLLKLSFLDWFLAPIFRVLYSLFL